ncbi:uncharacterized protein CDV56_102871 [Aspergillus thermomutatus]|uniref:Uncharacterized protein n=1 Tax=Aspergillus thermomutatus TaxID=41047 RepID=A0A397G771_ASPTH|nr:uncharacterized protein CDV56_102871 [Aspergillus thermomutatus]RHZ45216.1 hypothetical protein CDV56_102871 [Aspergillus thermomutatus]
MALTLVDGNKYGLSMLLELQHLGDKLLSISPWIAVTLSIISRLEETNALFHARDAIPNRDFQRMAEEMKYYRTPLEGHLKTLEFLEKKVQGILNQLAVAFSLQNQVTSIGINDTFGINDKMLKLTSDTVDDSATVRVVTLVTLIYLPASFVATFLGMNLFSFGESGSGFSISKQFWIYVAVAVPLTVLTLSTWWVITQKQKKKKAARRDAMSQEFWIPGAKT